MSASAVPSPSATSVSDAIPAPVIQVDSARSRLRIVLRGPCQIGSLPSIVARALDHDGFEPGMEILVDCRQCSNAPDTATIQALAMAISDSRSLWQGRVAILTTDGVAYGMGRMLEILVGIECGLDVRAFTQEAPLEAWLHFGAVA